MDISSLAQDKKLQVEVAYGDEIKLTINHISRERLAEIIRKATVTSFDNRHQRTEVFDNILFGELLGVEAIAGWSGLEADGGPFPCTGENKRLLMRKWTDFAKFVSDICTDLERLVAAEKEAARKNSQGTSGQGLITLA